MEIRRANTFIHFVVCAFGLLKFQYNYPFWLTKIFRIHF
jgi:hypothetical protein